MPELKVKDQPFYIQSVAVLFGLIGVTFIFWILADILVPLAFAVFLSIMLNPMVNWLMKHKLPRWLAILVALLVMIAGVAGIMYFLSAQIAQFKDTLPLLKQKLMQIADQITNYISTTFGVEESRQQAAVKEAMNNSKAFVGQTIFGVLGIAGILVLLPVYMFFILLYKPLLLNFLYEVFAEENSDKVGEVLAETKSSIQTYIVGLLIEAAIVAVMNSAALLLLGVKYAILIGVIGALLNLIPYLGGLVAIALPVLIATVTKDGYSTQIGVIVAYLVIQFIDNNILVPRIVSSKVQINALMSIIVVLLGNALWGISGMFLAIPFFAVLKIIFDRIDGLKPWGKLLGDDMPTVPIGARWKAMRERRKTQE